MSSSRSYYCPYCGYVYRNPFYQFKWTCEGCGARKVELKMFSHDDNYYNNKSIEKYGAASHASEFYDLESSQNPLYDIGRVNIRHRRAAQRFNEYMEKPIKSTRTNRVPLNVLLVAPQTSRKYLLLIKPPMP